MDAGYDELEAAASSYAKERPRDEDGDRGHRSHRERDYEREDRHRERRHRERDDGRDRERDRGDRDGHRDRDDRSARGDRDRDREREYRDRGEYRRGGGGEDEDRDRDRGYRRRRREDDGVPPPPGAGGGGGGGEPPFRRARYEEEPFAQPMRQYSPPPRGLPPPPPGRGGGRDDGPGSGPGGWRPPPPPRGGGDYGRGGGGGRGDDRRGGGGGGGGRQRSPPRSPTPPGTVPLDQRHIETSLWDVRPSQFDGIGAMAAKMTGMFTYGPGRVPPPAHLGVPEQLIVGAFPPSGGTINTINPVRQAKRLYIGGFTEPMKEEDLLKFFNDLMKEKELSNKEMKGKPILEASVNTEKLYAFLEFRSAEEASKAMALDGSTYEGIALRVRRPKDYIGIDPTLGANYLPGMIGTNVADTPNKLFIGGLPTYLLDEQVMELLKSFGELKSFNLVKEGTANGGGSKGFAFCEYIDTATTDIAIAGLHGFELGDRTLVVQRAAVGRNTGIPDSVLGTVSFLSGAPGLLAGTSGEDAAPTSRVMLLLNMVTPDELYSDDDYADILEDINEECSKYGAIEAVRVPRPIAMPKKWMPEAERWQEQERNRRMDEENGVGRVYVMYQDVEGTAKAMKAIGGRQFAGRTILVANIPEEETDKMLTHAQDEFLGTAPPPPPPPPDMIEDGKAEDGTDDLKPKEEDLPPPPPSPPPVDIDAAAADALKDLIG